MEINWRIVKNYEVLIFDVKVDKNKARKKHLYAVRIAFFFME